MTNQNIQLEIGDEIGFAQIKNDIDSRDNVVFFPIVEVTTRNNERAYRYLYPDGQVSASAIEQSRLSNYVIRINREIVLKSENAPNLAICLTERKDEFKQALKRSIDGDFTVFAGWDRDTFFVVNKANDNEYRVEFETIDEKVFAECECKDFMYRKRVCKHIAAALQEQFFGISLAV